jgi:hypothetical protein
VKFVKTIREVLDHDADGISVRGEINAVVAANVNEQGNATAAKSADSEQSSAQTPPPEGETDV